MQNNGRNETQVKLITITYWIKLLVTLVWGKIMVYMNVLIDNSRLVKQSFVTDRRWTTACPPRSVLRIDTVCALRSSARLNRDLSQGLPAGKIRHSHKGIQPMIELYLTKWGYICFMFDYLLLWLVAFVSIRNIRNILASGILSY